MTGEGRRAPAGRSPRALLAGAPGRVATAGAVLLATCIGGLIAAAYPPYATADEAHHVDHAWRVGHGELPAFDDGLTAPLGEARPSTVHYTWQHPPAFYLLEAPVIRPLLDAGRWRAAVLAGRLLPLALSAAIVGAVALAVRRGLPDAPPALAPAAAALAAVSNPLHLVSGWVYNDTLSVLAGVVALGATMAVVRGRAGRRTLAALVLACTLGMASRASFAIVLAIAVGGVVWAGRPRAGRPWRRTAAALAALVGLPLATSGWFYARNQRLAGDWTGSQPDRWAEELGRVARPPLEVVTDVDFWRAALSGLAPRPADVAVADRGAQDLALVVVGAASLLAALVGVLAWRAARRRGRVPLARLAVPAVLTLAVAGVVVQMVQHVANGGGANSRYLLPSLLPVSIAWAGGLLGIRAARGQLVTGFVAGTVVLLGAQHGAMLERRAFPGAGPWDAFERGIEANGLPVALLPLAVVGVLVGLGLLAAGLWHLAGERPAA